MKLKVFGVNRSGKYIVSPSTHEKKKTRTTKNKKKNKNKKNNNKGTERN